MRIGFLGVGNMGSAILKGYLESQESTKDDFVIFNRTTSKAQNLKAQLKASGHDVEIADSLKELIEKSDLFFLGVKPKDFEEVLKEISVCYTSDKLCVSMAAGISIKFIKSYLGQDSKVIRIMPNTPAKIGYGATSISVCTNICLEDEMKVQEIIGSLGVCIKVEEEHIHSVIGASGSSPAYTYLYMKALIDEAVESGLDKEDAKILVANSVIGAGYMLLKEDKEADELIRAVSSPGGTTVEALKTLKDLDFVNIVRQGFKSAVRRSKEMEK